MKKLFTLIIITLAFGITEMQAQKSLGISFENRSEEPSTGFGLHFQNDFTVVPMLLDVGFRLQGSFYSEEYDFGDDGLDIRAEDSSYDFGLGAIATASAGFVAPYAGFGVGYEFFERDFGSNSTDTAITVQDGSDNGFYYYGTVGVGASIVPLLRPFVEYRYRGVTSTDFMPSKYGTWAFGAQLRF
jgi:opacity protein-like surface antigen